MNILGHNAFKILITRPTGQHEGFAHRCHALGLDTVHLPCLSIKFLHGNGIVESLHSATGIVLFTSANAVRSAHLQRPFPWVGVSVHAIGQATARVLNSLNQDVSLIPPAPYNSEAYIEQLKALPRQPLLIVKGEGGRTQVRDALRLLGWPIAQIDVYQRLCPTVDQSEVDRVFENAMPALISVTSDEVLSNFLTITKHYQPAILQSQIIVNSQRCAQKAIDSGFSRQPLVSCPPGDDGQILCLKRWLLQA